MDYGASDVIMIRAKIGKSRASSEGRVEICRDHSEWRPQEFFPGGISFLENNVKFHVLPDE